MSARSSRIWVVLAIAVALHAAPSKALDILLTNDDGFSAIGIQTLKAALAAAGHNVTMVAPFGERSGSSAAINLVPVTPVQVGAQDWALIALDELITGDREPLPATPATCVLFGLSVTLEGVAPDLIVSGTNVGANVGTATPFSGTVGGTTAGLAADVPAIAFSSDPPDVDEDDPAFAAHYANVAAFAVSLIAHLESKPGALANEPGLLPEGLALNVNYPTLAPEEVSGVKLTVQGQAASASLVFVPLGGGIFIPAVGPGSGDEPDVKDSDTEALAAGYITVTPINSDMTAPPQDGARFESVVAGLNP
jgi:5'-nucleotidase